MNEFHSWNRLIERLIAKWLGNNARTYMKCAAPLNWFGDGG